MVKKLLAFLLAALLAFSGVAVLAEEEAKAQTISQLHQLMVEFFDKYDYSYDLDGDVYTLDFSMDSSLASCEIGVRVYYDAIEIIVTPDVSAAEANREKLALFLTLLNYKIFYTQFGMKLDNGAFYARGVQLVEKTLPGLEEVDVLFHMALGELDNYGDAIAQVAFAGADPYEAYDKMTAE